MHITISNNTVELFNLQIEAAITKFDKAGNGKLDYLEFCGMMNAGKNRKESGEAAGSGSKSDTPQVMSTQESRRGALNGMAMAPLTIQRQRV